MKKKILIGIIICILIVGIIISIKKPFNSKKENLNDEFIGKWQTISAINSETGEKTNNLTDVFGSSFLQFHFYNLAVI